MEGLDYDVVYPEETYSPTKGRNTPSKETSKPPSKDWKRRLEEANEEVEAISDDSFHYSELFQMDEASLLQLAHTKLPYFHSVRELRAREYDFRFNTIVVSRVAFDKLFKVSKRTKTVEQQEPHPAK